MWMNISCACHHHTHIPCFSFFIFCVIFEQIGSISFQRLFSFPTASLLHRQRSFLMISFAAFIFDSMRIYNFLHILSFYSFHMNNEQSGIFEYSRRKIEEQKKKWYKNGKCELFASQRLLCSCDDGTWITKHENEYLFERRRGNRKRQEDKVCGQRKSTNSMVLYVWIRV